jgi:ADP-heptose:LPS heptosyltransferase/lauroyl/myristoyl acyltransferase
MPTRVFIVSGWLAARAPEWLLRALAAVLGEGLLWASPRRRRLIYSNLAHAFPDWTPARRRRVARRSARLLIETGLLSLATPFLSEARIRSIARLGPSAEAWARDRAGRARPTVFGTVHLAHWEAQTWFKLLSPVPLPEFGIIFRPLEPASLDAYVKRTRERFGMRLLSRREGFAEALRLLRADACVGILMDQNAGHQGALTTFLGRVCSTTELPGLLASRHKAEVRTFYPRRTGFWRMSLESDAVPNDGTAAGITIAANRWLEDVLRRDEGLCAGWLWAHDRWRHQDEPHARFRLASKRDLLSEDRAARGWPGLPRTLRVWVRIPNWLGDVVMAIPLLRALRASRPDAEITLVGRRHLLPLLDRFGIADRLEPLPERGPGYLAHFWRLRGAYPDVWLLLTHSLRGDLEAWLAGAPQRFGLVRSGRSRPLLSHGYRVPADVDERTRHQLDLWEAYLRSFGLEGALDLSPLPPGPRSGGPIGLIPGSENDPSKRWPVGHWRRLISAMPDRRFVLFGTERDVGIADAVAEGFPADRVENLAGKTGLPAFADRLSACSLLVSNDTGGMHLANALGVPVVGLFGPTNPVRTGPVFAAPVRILQPPGCPPTGGGSLAGLSPESVIAAIANLGTGGKA